MRNGTCITVCVFLDHSVYLIFLVYPYIFIITQETHTGCLYETFFTSLFFPVEMYGGRLLH